jgi:hypothetical protein
MPPGSTVLTRMRWAASSIASDPLIVSRAALDAL